MTKTLEIQTDKKIGRVVWDAKEGEYVVKRTFTCRAYYDFDGCIVKCQLHGRHKGIHVHGMSRPGTIITITWHSMVTTGYGAVKPKKGKKSSKTMLRNLELEAADIENSPELMLMS